MTKITIYIAETYSGAKFGCLEPIPEKTMNLLKTPPTTVSVKSHPFNLKRIKEELNEKVAYYDRKSTYMKAFSPKPSLVQDIFLTAEDLEKRIADPRPVLRCEPYLKTIKSKSIFTVVLMAKGYYAGERVAVLGSLNRDDTATPFVQAFHVSVIAFTPNSNSQLSQIRDLYEEVSRKPVSLLRSRQGFLDMIRREEAAEFEKGRLQRREEANQKCLDDKLRSEGYRRGFEAGRASKTSFDEKALASNLKILSNFPTAFKVYEIPNPTPLQMEFFGMLAQFLANSRLRSVGKLILRAGNVSCVDLLSYEEFKEIFKSLESKGYSVDFHLGDKSKITISWE